MGSIKASKNGEFKSQVPHVMLHLNPGVARHQNLHIQKLDKLKNKVCTIRQVIEKNCLDYYMQLHK